MIIFDGIFPQYIFKRSAIQQIEIFFLCKKFMPEEAQ